MSQNQLQSSEPVVKREVISSDKDGTLEKVHFAPRVVVDEKTGAQRVSEPWEIRATGKKTNELRGSFKNVKDDMLHQGMKDWEDGGGDLTITKPDGSTDVIRADKEHLYRQQPGFCVTATRPTFTMDGFGGMKREGIIRRRVKWTTDGKMTETVYSDGRKTLEVS